MGFNVADTASHQEKIDVLLFTANLAPPFWLAGF